MFVGSLPVLLVLFFSGLTVSASHLGTNAERLANGLPPRSPSSFGRIMPGYRDTLYKRQATPVTPAKRSQPSTGPTTTWTGRIEVRNPDGSSLGFVRNRADGSSISGVNEILDPTQDVRVEIKVSKWQKTPTNLLVTNAAFPAPYYVGAAGNVYHKNIGPGLSNTVAFTNVDRTPPGSKPVASTTRPGDFVESAIWYIKPDTLELTARYVNPDGSTPSTVIAYDIRENSIFFVGDIAAYNKNNDTPASSVKLFLTPGN